MEFFFFLFFFYLVGSIYTSWAAIVNNRSGFAWFVNGIVLSPPLAVLLMIATNSALRPQPVSQP